VDVGRIADVWLERGAVVEVLTAELIPPPPIRSGVRVNEDAGPAQCLLSRR
jgi:hypothetical protein